jgi:DNA-binding NtrC family response regulator
MAHFLKLYSQRHGRTPVGFTPRATDALLKYDYPGNVRELQNLIERGVVYAEHEGMVDIVHMFNGSESPPSFTMSISTSGKLYQAHTDAHVDRLASNSEQSFERIERSAYEQALADADGNVAGAARKLGISRAKLDYRLRRLGITPRRTIEYPSRVLTDSKRSIIIGRSNPRHKT